MTENCRSSFSHSGIQGLKGVIKLLVCFSLSLPLNILVSSLGPRKQPSSSGLSLHGATWLQHLQPHISPHSGSRMSWLCNVSNWLNEIMFPRVLFSLLWIFLVRAGHNRTLWKITVEQQTLWLLESRRWSGPTAAPDSARWGGWSSCLAYSSASRGSPFPSPNHSHVWVWICGEHRFSCGFSTTVRS